MESEPETVLRRRTLLAVLKASRRAATKGQAVVDTVTTDPPTAPVEPIAAASRDQISADFDDQSVLAAVDAEVRFKGLRRKHRAKAQAGEEVPVGRRPSVTPARKAQVEQWNIPPTLIFCRTVESAVELQRWLQQNAPHIRVAMLHKKLSREERESRLSALAAGQIQALVATDIASRGLDTASVEHVIQYEFSRDAVSYLHRIGRTARAGQWGHVTNLIATEDVAFASALRDAQAQGSIDTAFSRRRSFRRNLNRMGQPSEPEETTTTGAVEDAVTDSEAV